MKPSPAHAYVAQALARAITDMRREKQLRAQGAPSAPWWYAAVAAMGAHAALAEDAALPREQLEQVVIKGTRVEEYVSTEPSIGKLTEKTVDTPQAITTVSGAELADRAASNLNDALRTVPGISLGAGETSFQGNNMILRGFTTRNDMFADGQRDYGYYYRDPFNLEQVEVLKGPSSILFGRGSTGGVINQVGKSPALTSSLAASAVLSTAHVRRATADVGAPLPALGAGAAFRVNVMGDHSETADRDGTHNDRWGIAPSLALGLGSPTRLRVGWLHQSDDGVPDYGIPWFAGRPAAVARNNNYGFSSDYLKTDVNAYTARFEHDFDSTLQLASQARYSRDTREFRYTEAVIPAGTAASTPPSSITVNRSEYQGSSTDTFFQGQTDLTARFATGSVGHALVAGVEIGRETPNPTYVANAGVPATQLANPQDLGYSATQTYTRLTASTSARTLAVYALDTMKLGTQWQVMGGVRWDRFDAHYHSTGFTPSGATAAVTDVDSDSDGFSYRGALVYKPGPDSSLYASFGNSFNPSAEGIESLISAGRSVAQANLNLDPEKSRTYELGSKWSLLEQRVLLSGSVFRLEKSNVRVPDPNLAGFNTLGGDQRVEGAELEATGQVNPSWKLRAGYTYLDSQTTRSTPGGPLVGAPLTGAPRNTVTLFTEHHLGPSFEVALGGLYMSSRLGQNTLAAYELTPGYAIFEAMARYTFSAAVSLQLNVNNLADRYFLDQLHPAHVVPGEGRSARLTLNVKY